MANHHPFIIAPKSKNFPMVDTDFDHFELDADIKHASREVEAALFYRDTLNEEE